MKNSTNISGIVSRCGFGDGDWFSRDNYAALGVRIGEALLKRNPKSTFSVVQVSTSHNPIRLHETFAGQEIDLDLSGLVSLRGLKPLLWSSPTFTWEWADDAPTGGGYGDFVEVVNYDGFEGVIFEVVGGFVTFRRDLHGLKRPKIHPDCPYCGQIGGVSQYDSICGEHGPAIGYASEDGLKFTPAQ